MSDSFKACRCGRRIPAEWPERCEECRLKHRRWVREGYEPGFLFHAIRDLQVKGLLGPDPLPDGLIEPVVDAIQRRTQEHGLMVLREVVNQGAHFALQRRYAAMRQEEGIEI